VVAPRGPEQAGALARYRARVLEAESPGEIAREIERTEAEPSGVGALTRKGRTLLIRLEDVPLRASPLLKQEMLAVGADSAHARGVLDFSVKTTPVILLGSPGQYHQLFTKLRRPPSRLADIADAVESALDHYLSQAPRTIHGIHRSLSLGDRTRVLGVLNLTPDSFSDGGRYVTPPAALRRAREMVREGADAIDVGAESTRPGATTVSVAREIQRLEPVLGRLHEVLEVPISVDTRKPEVARKALALGADLVNDVSGLRDPAMRQLLVRTGAPAIVMHMRGTPRTMQRNVAYADLRGEVYAALADATARAIQEGVSPDQLLVDPGLGFGKAPEQNLELLHHLGEFRSLGFPVVVGASRKSFLGRATGGAPPAQRREAGIAAAVIAALRGAHVIRTHDVEATARALALVDAVRHGRFRDDAGSAGAGRN
jgi:dihydropteroate synthase